MRYASDLELRRFVLARAEALCRAENSELLYLTVFGSDLYGTSTGCGDLDLRGIFMPSLQTIVLGKDKAHIHFSTADDASRNTPEDVDIDLFALGDWLLRLLPEGNIGAQDLLFSPSSPSRVIFRSPILDPVFNNPLKFINLANTKGLIQYCLRQTKKYGIKGSRLGALLRVRKWLDCHGEEGRLGDFLQEISAWTDDRKHCAILPLRDGLALSLCGKVHQGGMRLGELRDRVDFELEKYGERAGMAEKNQGLDFKALSHALRALDQMEELLLTGRIVFPLKTRENLKRVKSGELGWRELEKLILERLAYIETLRAERACKYPYKPESAEEFLLSCYNPPKIMPRK